MAESENSAAEPAPADGANSVFNALVLLDEATLNATLQQSYPEMFEPDTTRDIPHRSKLIVRTLQIARKLLTERNYKSVTKLKEDVIRQLAKEDILHYGLSEHADVVSSSWMEKLLARRGYRSIQAEIAATQQRAR